MGSRPARTALLAAVFLLACASPAPPPAAEGPVDWAAVADQDVVEVVTTDPEGAERVTKVWLVVVDGQGFLRTGSTRWFGDVERDPDVVLWAGGRAHPLRAVLVEDGALHARVNEAFRAKYGWQDFLVHPLGAEDAPILRLDARREG